MLAEGAATALGPGASGKHLKVSPQLDCGRRSLASSKITNGTAWYSGFCPILFISTEGFQKIPNN